MRVLQIHKTFHSTGGADTFFFKTCDLLEEHGHEVGHFSTKHARNRHSEYSKYFVEGFTDSDVSHLSVARKAKAFFDGIYSFDAKKNLSRLIEDFKPDLAHAHSFNYQLSPAIFDAFRSSHIPLIVTLHDYHVICGAGTLYVDGAPCERCLGGRHYNLLRHSCYWNAPASLMAMLSHYLHDARKSWGVPSKLIAPSYFLKQKLIQFGIPERNIEHIPIFIDFPEKETENHSGAEYVLYFGRLAENKGVKVLVEAAQKIGCKLFLIGDGQLANWVEEQCATSGGKFKRVPYVHSRQELQKHIAKAAFSVIPSLWYENQPAVVLETYAMSRPVIGSSLGGIPELIEDGRTGLLCDPGNVLDLAEKMSYILERPKLSRDWGQNGNRKLCQEFSRRLHYDRLIAVYNALLPVNQGIKTCSEVIA